MRVVDLLHRALRALNVNNDALAEHRLSICRKSSALGAALMLPFVVIHLLNGRWLMAGVNALGGMVLAMSAWALSRGRPAPVPFPVLGAMLVAAVCVSVLKQGVLGLLWAYPALLVCYFILTRRLATVLGTVLVVAVTAIGALVLEAGLAVRVGISLVFVQMMVNVVLNVIGELQQALVAQTITDPLTGAFNRRHLDAQLGERVAAAAAAPLAPGAPGGEAGPLHPDHPQGIQPQPGHEPGDAPGQVGAGRVPERRCHPAGRQADAPAGAVEGSDLLAEDQGLVVGGHGDGLAQGQADRRPRHDHPALLGGNLLEVEASVPDQVPDAVQGVEEQEEREAEQDQPAALDEGTRAAVRKQTPGEQEPPGDGDEKTAHVAERGENGVKLRDHGISFPAIRLRASSRRQTGREDAAG